MSVLYKAAFAFAVAGVLGGSVHLDTPRRHTLAMELHAAHPRAALAAQLRRLLANGPV